MSHPRWGPSWAHARCRWLDMQFTKKVHGARGRAIVEFAKSAAAQRRLHELVPGGAHTYARGSDQYPAGMAPVIVRGNGARVVDLDGNTFVEYGMGLRVGHARPRLPPGRRGGLPRRGRGRQLLQPLGLGARAAERFLTQVPTADMVKFTKNGSDATTAALRLARAATGRELVADLPRPALLLRRRLVHRHHRHGRRHPAERRPRRHRDVRLQRPHLARGRPRRGIPGRSPPSSSKRPPAPPSRPPASSRALRALADKDGFVLVFDEMITGMRWAAGGAQSVYGVTPGPLDVGEGARQRLRGLRPRRTP